MKSALNRAQREAEARHGARHVALVDGPLLALGRVAREAVHSHHLGIAVNPKGCAAVAKPELVATGSAYSIRTARHWCTCIARRRAPEVSSHCGPVALPIALGVPADERCRRFVPGGRRSVASASRLRQIATNSCRALLRGGSAKPFRVDPNGVQPAIESHLAVLSGVPGSNGHHHCTQGIRKNGNVFQGA